MERRVELTEKNRSCETCRLLDGAGLDEFGFCEEKEKWVKKSETCPQWKEKEAEDGEEK